MTKILVCGANGQLGSSLKDLSGKFVDFHFDFTDIDELDLTDSVSLESYIARTLPDYIINCAAYTSVDKAEAEPEKAFLLNAEVVNNLYKAAVKSDSKLIHISTDYVFNGRNYRPYTESDLPDPDSVYGLSKLKGESYLSDIKNSMIIRTSWLYSKFGNNFLKTILRLCSEREEIRIVFDQVGTPTWAGDLAEALLEIVEKTGKSGSDFKGGIYHYSNEGVASWYDFAKEIIDIRNTGTKIMPIETRDYPLPAPRPPFSVLNKGKIRNSFGIAIPNWKDSLHICLSQID
ncbi:MAG: dTDP-4-dehydrorhamnose reductase [Bacteroidales bacterium]|nr:dTDP-4-dehydrorhamnose reductase [Bacteroidales bacterium]MCB9013293.1 dTDP-4-dehydrorhamnose reductase [Bacteroidales bacterium]